MYEGGGKLGNKRLLLLTPEQILPENNCTRPILDRQKVTLGEFRLQFWSQRSPSSKSIEFISIDK